MDRETKALLVKKRDAIRAERDETASLRQRLEGGESDGVLLGRLASLEIAAGRFESALPYQERLIQQDSSSANQRRLAYLYLQLGRYHDALPVYEKILSRPDADASAN